MPFPSAVEFDPQTVFRRYGLAVLWSVVFSIARLGLSSLMEESAPMLLLLAAPILAAWAGGLGPGLCATAVSAVLGEGLLQPPGLSVGVTADWVRMGIFLAYGIAFSWLIQKRSHAMRRAEEEHLQLEASQRELIEREQRASDTLEASPAGMLVVNRLGVIELANTQAERLFALRREQLIGLNVDQLVPESIRASHAANRERFHAHPSARAMGHGRDLWARRGDGSVFPVEIGLNPLRGASSGLVLASVIDISSRKHVEQELALREQRMRETLEASPAGMLVVNQHGIVELANTQAERLFDLRRDQLIGMQMNQLVPDASGQDPWARRGDGSVFPVEIGLNPLKGASSGLVLASVIDISLRKQAEQALRESERQRQESTQRVEADHAVLDAILRAVPAGITVADRLGRLVRSNPATERIWGRSPEALSVEDYGQWKGWWADGSAQHGQPIAPQEWAMARALQGESVVDDLVEIEPFNHPGQRRTLLVTAGPIRDARDQTTGAVVAQLDVTDLVKAQAAERESAAMLRSLVDNISQLAWMTDPSGATTWYNRRWYEYTGAAEGEMKGWGWRAVQHPDHVDRVVSKFRRHVATGEPWEDTFPLRGQDGRYRWFLSRAFPIHDRIGHVLSWFGTNTDITAQRQAEEALREADQRKDEFIAVLAHELRNPLAPVRSAVEILKRVGPTEPRIERTREIIARQVHHMSRLIDDLLDISRISRGRLALQKERCDLSRIAREVAEDYRPSIEASHQRLAVHVPPGPLWVHGDPVRLAQMMGNLLNNASRFNQPDGLIEVHAEAEPSGGFARMCVKDSGIGIAPELMARLFDPFEQAAQDIARSRGGLGLGLALTKGLVELHGGHVKAYSEGPGKGATFTLRVPLMPEDAAAASEQTPGSAAASALRILVVEDNTDAAATLGELLELDGHQVELSHDAVAGLDKARQFHPHVVISDLGLPGTLDGYGLARALRADPELASIRLIALSGYADQAARLRSTDAGFDIHLPKPPDIDALQRVLRSVPAGIASHSAD